MSLILKLAFQKATVIIFDQYQYMAGYKTVIYLTPEGSKKGDYIFH